MCGERSAVLPGRRGGQERDLVVGPPGGADDRLLEVLPLEDPHLAAGQRDEGDATLLGRQGDACKGRPKPRGCRELSGDVKA